jgi:hypothetical protein
MVYGWAVREKQDYGLSEDRNPQFVFFELLCHALSIADYSRLFFAGPRESNKRMESNSWYLGSIRQGNREMRHRRLDINLTMPTLCPRSVES